MALQFSVDLRGKTSIDQVMNDQVREGWYWAKLVEVDESVDSRQAIFSYEILEGPCRGKKLKHHIPDPAYVTRDKFDKASSRVAALAARLGLVGQDDLDKQAEGTWLDAIGAEVFLKVDPPGEGQQMAGIAYIGVYPADYNPMDSDFDPALAQHRTCKDPQVRVARGAAGKAKAKPKPDVEETEPDVSDLVA